MSTFPIRLEDPDFVTLANRLPIIVTEPGRYRLRNGIEVDVHEVQDNGPLNQTRYAVKGTYYLKRGTRKIPQFDIWHVSGRYASWLNEYFFDIVEKL